MIQTRIFILCLAVVLVSANFDFFGNMFGGQYQQQQQQQQQQPRSGASHWAAYLENTPCSQYLCPTLDCVEFPADCPCPDEQDTKCTIPDPGSNDATVVCVRGEDGCAEVQRLMEKGKA